MSTRHYQFAVFGCMLSWFLLGLHAPVLHQFTHHGRTPSAPMVVVLLILVAGAFAGLVVLLRTPRRDASA